MKREEIPPVRHYGYRVHGWIRRSGGSSRIRPGTAEQDGAVDDADQGIGLRIVAPQRLVPQRQVLRQQSGMGPSAQHLLEDLAFDAADVLVRDP